MKNIYVTKWILEILFFTKVCIKEIGNLNRRLKNLTNQSEKENLMGDELVTVSNWLTTLKEPYTANVQYEFFLPESEEARYLEDVKQATNQPDIWKIIK